MDVQSTTAQTVLTKQVLDAIPAGRSHLTQAILVPGLTASQGAARGNLMDVGGTRNLQNTLVSIHGGRDGDTRVQIDGVRIGNMSGAGQWHNFVPDQGRHAGTGDRLRRGVGRGDLRRPPHQLRAQGGRQHVRGIALRHGGERGLAGHQYHRRTEGRGASARRTPLRRMYDINPNGGGPIIEDKLWFYASARFQENKNYVAGLYVNRNAGDPTKWLYDPDTQPSRRSSR